MIGATLGDIRDHIEALASETGEYYLVCSRYGDRPVPAAGLRFANRPTARAAARATEQYRTALRRYDPQMPTYDVIVCQDAIVPDPPDQGDRRYEDHDCLTGIDGRQSLIEYCHRVAGAVFETVAASSHDRLERAIMDTYFERAETIDRPNELCLRLVESMATEIDTRLTPHEQANVLITAASRLSPPAATENPLDTTLAQMRSIALTADYTFRRSSTAPDTHTRSWDVTLSGYALTRTGDQLATLPLVIDLLRRNPNPALRISEATHTGGETPTWCFRLTTTSNGDPTGLASVPVISLR